MFANKNIAIASAVALLSILPCQTGDMNRDGVITTTDLVQLRLAIGSTDGMGDLNFNGRVDEDDLRIMREKLSEGKTKMRISGKGLGMVRSDTELLTWYMVDTTDTLIPLVTGDTVYFKLWCDMDTETPLLTKTITTFSSGKAEINFLPADTKDIEPGEYFYSIYVVYADTDEQTPIARYPFKLRRR